MRGLQASLCQYRAQANGKLHYSFLGLTLCLGVVAVKTLPVLLIGHVLLVVSALLAWISAVQYLRSVYAAFTEGERTKSL